MIFFNGSYHRLTLKLEGRVVNSLWRLKTGEKSSVFAGYRRFSHTKKQWNPVSSLLNYGAYFYVRLWMASKLSRSIVVSPFSGVTVCCILISKGCIARYCPFSQYPPWWRSWPLIGALDVCVQRQCYEGTLRILSCAFVSESRVISWSLDNGKVLNWDKILNVETTIIIIIIIIIQKRII